MRRTLMGLIAITALGCAAGCGERPATVASSPSLPSTALIAHADAVCKRFQASTEQLVQRVNTARGTLSERRDQLMDASVRLRAIYVHDLAALVPPNLLESRYARYVATERARLALSRSALDGTATRTRRAGAVRAHEAIRLARSLGLESCPR